MERDIEIVEENGQKIVQINKVLFKGKSRFPWHEIEKYLARYRGMSYAIFDTGETIYLDRKFEDEYCGSVYTESLRGGIARAKANAVQGIPEMIEIASKPRFRENLNDKHIRDARNGWYRYETKISFPVFDDKGKLERRNVFQGELLVRCAENGKKYLYDFINIRKIKKETSNPL